MTRVISIITAMLACAACQSEPGPQVARLPEATQPVCHNFTVPVKSDRDVSEDDLRSHHLLLVGRPDSNRVVERFRASLPVGFGRRSFTARGNVCLRNPVRDQPGRMRCVIECDHHVIQPES